MRIVIYSQAFYPDHSGIPVYSSDFAFYCAELGHEVHVITGFPFYPSWKKKNEDQGKLFRTDRVNGITIHRGYLYVPEKPSAISRVFHELSLFTFSFLNSLKIRKPDLIVTFTTPILIGVLGSAMKVVWGCRHVINVQDFELEAALSLGMFREGRATRLIESVEKWSYRKADYVSSISYGMLDLLKNRKSLPPEKILYWPNWNVTGNRGSAAVAPKGLFREEFGIPGDRKIIAYAGNIGKKQGLELLVDVAAAFQHREEFLFLIIGEGAGLTQVKEYAATKSLKNLRFIPMLNSEKYQRLLADSDAMFVSQAKTQFDVYFPSKVIGILNAGKLLILTADRESELYKVTKMNGLGLIADYDNPAELMENVRKFMDGEISEADFRDNMAAFVSSFEKETVLNGVLAKIGE